MRQGEQVATVVRPRPTCDRIAAAVSSLAWTFVAGRWFTTRAALSIWWALRTSVSCLPVNAALFTTPTAAARTLSSALAADVDQRTADRSCNRIRRLAPMCTPHPMRGSSVLYESTSQVKSRSVQPLLRGPSSRPTHTERSLNVCSRIHCGRALGSWL